MSGFSERLHDEIERRLAGASSTAPGTAGAGLSRVIVSHPDQDHVAAHSLGRLLRGGSPELASVRVVGWGAVGAVGAYTAPQLSTSLTWRSWRHWAPVAGLAALMVLVIAAAAAAALVSLGARQPDLVQAMGVALALLIPTLPPIITALRRRVCRRP